MDTGRDRGKGLLRATLFLEALFIMAKYRKQPKSPSSADWINKVEHPHNATLLSNERGALPTRKDEGEGYRQNAEQGGQADASRVAGVIHVKLQSHQLNQGDRKWGGALFEWETVIKGVEASGVMSCFSIWVHYTVPFTA